MYESLITIMSNMSYEKIRHRFQFFSFRDVFIYLNGRVTERKKRQKQTDGQRVIVFICWFIPHMASVARAEPG